MVFDLLDQCDFVRAVFVEGLPTVVLEAARGLYRHKRGCNVRRDGKIGLLRQVMKDVGLRCPKRKERCQESVSFLFEQVAEKTKMELV